MKKNQINWTYIIIFLIITYALFWIPYILSKITVSNGNNIWGSLLGILGPYSPLLAAVIIRSLISREGYKDAHLGIRKTVWRYWVLALLLPFFWNGIQDIFHLLFNFTTLKTDQILSGLYRIPINLLGGMVIFIGEEFGWRSYLVEKLRPLGRWKTLLISGAFWSLWHLPFVIDASGSNNFYTSLIGILIASFIYILFGFIFGWLYLEAKSVWPCVLMHSYNNLVTMKLLNWEVIQEPSFVQNSLMAVFPILIVWLVLFFKGKFTGDALDIEEK